MGDRGVEGAADGSNELIKSNTRGLVYGFEEKCPKIYGGQHDSRAARAAPGPEGAHQSKLPKSVKSFS